MDRAPPEAKRASARLQLAVIAALFALPILAAWTLHLAPRAPRATSNYGTLIAPRPLAAAPIAALRGKWVLVQFDRGACDARCEQKLYYMRQVRRAQGANADRVERLWVITDGAAPGRELLAAIEGTHVVRDGAAIATAFPADGALAEHIWLVDPLGNLMLRFPAHPDPGKMVRDLEHLLKYSSFG